MKALKAEVFARALLCSTAFSLSTPALHADVEKIPAQMQLVTDLSPWELWRPLLVNNGVLWVAQENGPNSSRRLEAYDMGGTRRVDVLPIEHTVFSLRRLDDKTVLAVGRSPYRSFAHDKEPIFMDPDKPEIFRELDALQELDDHGAGYEGLLTVAKLENGRIRSSRFTIPGDVIPTDVISHKGQLYGVEPGSAALFAFDQRSLRKFPSDYSWPEKMVAIGNDIWVMEWATPVPQDDMLTVTSISNGQRDVVAKLFGVKDIIKTDDERYVVVVEKDAQKISLFNVAKKQLADSLAIEGAPYGLTQMGSCVVATNGEQQSLTIAKIEHDKLSYVETWDISAAGDKLKDGSRIEYDASSKRLFVKSSYNCPSCSTTQASVWSATPGEGSVVKTACGL